MTIALPDHQKSWIGYLCHLHAELGRINTPIDELRPYQRSILSDLEYGPSENALARVHNRECYSEAAIDESRGKPLIDVDVRITSKGNLTVLWWPRHRAKAWNEVLETNTNDWARPTNELFIVRDIVHARASLGFDVEKCLPKVVDQILLLATYAAVKGLRSRLEHAFDVRLKSDIFLTRAGDGSGKLIGWEVENIEERVERLELNELEEFSRECSIGMFVDAVNRSREKKKTGPAPKGTDESVSKLLRDQGLRAMMPAVVRRYRELLRKHRPEVLPEWDRLQSSS